jgi:hypothetical protein
MSILGWLQAAFDVITAVLAILLHPHTIYWRRR